MCHATHRADKRIVRKYPYVIGCARRHGCGDLHSDHRKTRCFHHAGIRRLKRPARLVAQETQHAGPALAALGRGDVAGSDLPSDSL